jgi:hypothetical protein
MTPAERLRADAPLVSALAFVEVWRLGRRVNAFWRREEAFLATCKDEILTDMVGTEGEFYNAGRMLEG